MYYNGSFYQDCIHLPFVIGTIVRMNHVIFIQAPGTSNFICNCGNKTVSVRE